MSSLLEKIASDDCGKFFSKMLLIVFVNSCSILLSFQINKRNLILLFLTIGQLFFVLHFGLLGAWSAGAMNFIAMIRGYVFYNREKFKWAKSIFWLYFFISIFWVAGILTWKNFYTLFLTVAMTIDSFSLWQKEEKILRMTMLLPRPLWFIYNFTVHSYAGMLTEVFIFLSLLIGIIRFDVKNKLN